MNIENHIIQMLWVRNPVPWYVHTAISSFLERGHEVHIYSYEPLEGVNLRAKPMDAEEILSSSRIFTYKDGWAAGHLSGFADWFRYKLLFERGGWWVDTDVICLKPFTSEKRFVFASEHEVGDPKSITNNIIYARNPGEEIFAKACEICEERGADVGFAETGPLLVSNLVKEMGLLEFVEDPEIFNPVHYGDIGTLLLHPFVFQMKKIYRQLRGRRPILLSSRSSSVHLYANLLKGLVLVEQSYSGPTESVLWELICNATGPQSR